MIPFVLRKCPFAIASSAVKSLGAGSEWRYARLECTKGMVLEAMIEILVGLPRDWLGQKVAYVFIGPLFVGKRKHIHKITRTSRDNPRKYSRSP